MVTYLASLVALTAALTGAAPDPSAAGSFETHAEPTAHGKIDELVFASQKRLGLRPAALCSDAVFVRRVYLDTIGTVPTADETRQFLGDRGPNKRRRSSTVSCSEKSLPTTGP